MFIKLTSAENQKTILLRTKDIKSVIERAAYNVVKTYEGFTYHVEDSMWQIERDLKGRE